MVSQNDCIMLQNEQTFIFTKSAKKCKNCGTHIFCAIRDIAVFQRPKGRRCKSLTFVLKPVASIDLTMILRAQTYRFAHFGKNLSMSITFAIFELLQNRKLRYHTRYKLPKELYESFQWKGLELQLIPYLMILAFLHPGWFGGIVHNFWTRQDINKIL